MNPSPLSAQAPSSEQQAPAPDQAAASASAQLLDQLLKLADDYRAERGVRQAMEIYFEVAEDHADTPQGDHARQRLLDIARRYERDGSRRQARSMYERLL